ncbi:alpha/beta fold hydrolase [Pseudidiomarina taiwanensis]|uniref:Lysophospholipase n=1 Tax=Pseudidiomarina taiwanensis TaxID=337250 RepID=A0A432ZFH0_9GAMM|nr:alpha/beta fold hydrolase [Pseudidiomarina taiwanensis]RUO76708.1 lysophospholipase [Pseudidiomarina taiwanensis]
MHEQFDAFWHQHVVEYPIERPDGLTLTSYLYLPEQPRAVLWVSPGRLEAGIKYQELVYELAQQQYAVAILDHRGQGHSERESDHPQRGHINDFNDFVGDFEAFVDMMSAKLPQDLPGVILGHSMGGAIAALYLAAGKAPASIQAAVFSAPMIGINTGAVPRWLAHLIASAGAYLNRWLSPNKPWYFFGSGDYDHIPFTRNQLTHSEARYNWFRHLYETHPDIKLGGPTFNWVRQALVACDKAEMIAHEITIPVTVIQAGGDKIVDLKAQKRFAAMLQHPRSRLLMIPNCRHEVFMEADVFRRPALEALLDQLYLVQRTVDPYAE